jgi:transcriptional regulator with XRE-family HTH domain
MSTAASTKPEFGPAFGNRLANARRAAGITQEELASAVGLGKGAISSWEVGRTQPSAEQLAVITKRLRVSADSLLRADKHHAEAR